MTTTPVLKYFDPAEEVTEQCDASQTGIRAALMQKEQPVSYTSRSLTETEKNYGTDRKRIALYCVWS